jgi:hypothetical protein
MALSPCIGDKFTLDREVLQKLILQLTGSGKQVIGLTVRDGATVYAEVNSITDSDNLKSKLQLNT